MIKLRVENFRILRDFTLEDPTKLSIIVGYNECGKSSIINAIKFAATGEAYGYRGKALGGLVSHGETRMSVRVNVGHHYFYRTSTGGGDPLKAVAERFGVPAEVLPLLFDSRMCGDGGNKHLLAFLNGVASSRFDALIHFGSAPDIRLHIEQARKAGKLTTAAIIQYCCDMRAAQKAPSQPVPPAGSAPTESEIAAAKKTKAEIDEKLRTAEQQHSESRSLSQALGQLRSHQNALVVYETQRKAAAVGDPLGEKREAHQRVIGLNLASLDAMYEIISAVEDKPFLRLRELIAEIESIKHISAAALQGCPPPPSMPRMPVLPAEAKEIADRLTGDVKQELLLSAAKQEQSDHAVVTALRAEQQKADQALSALLRLDGAWMAYRNATPEWETQKIKAEAEWHRWDVAAKEIAAAEADFQAKQGDAFGKMVSTLSSVVLNGRVIKIDPAEGIFLGPEKIEDCSESTRWRVEVAVQAAVARSLKSPILMLDGADILDIKNRNNIVEFLLNHIVPHFEHVILTSTAKEELEKEQPLPSAAAQVATKWLLQNGQLKSFERKS